MKLDSKDVPHLEGAAQREDRLVPPPTGVSVSARRSMLARLVRAGLAGEVAVEDEAIGWRRTAQTTLGLRITDAGLAALEPPSAAAEEPGAAAPRTTKRAGVIALMQREGGAGVGELMAETGWQPHTVRAAITGLRKSGLAVETTRGEAGAVYRIVPGAAEAAEG